MERDASQPPLVFVTVGIDEDLSESVGDSGARRSGRAHTLVQHGTTDPPSAARSTPYLSYSEALQGAAAAVSRGGSALYSPADLRIAVRRDSARTATRAEDFVERLVRARGKQRARMPLH